MANPDSYPAIFRILPYIHGTYNFGVFLLFLYQAGVGIKIRRERFRGAPPDFQSIRRHRKFGPLLVLGGILGFFAGMLIVSLKEGHIVEHPFHFAVGCLIVFLLILTFIVSRQIRGRESQLRNLHLTAGILILCSYAIQILLGLYLIFQS